MSLQPLQRYRPCGNCDYCTYMKVNPEVLEIMGSHCEDLQEDPQEEVDEEEVKKKEEEEEEEDEDEKELTKN